MPKVYHVVPPFYEWLQKFEFHNPHLTSRLVEAPWWSSDFTHLEVSKGKEIVAKIYDRIVYLYDPSFEGNLTALAAQFEKLFSEDEAKITIVIKCTYRKVS